jgi:hypothetical protein
MDNRSANCDAACSYQPAILLQVRRSQTGRYARRASPGTGRARWWAARSYARGRNRCGSSRHVTAIRNYRTLFGPTRGEDAVWDLEPGPALRLTSDVMDRYARLRIQVSAIERAREFLKREALIGRSSAIEFQLDPARVEGAEISFSMR